jgi:hypothetical protein
MELLVDSQEVVLTHALVLSPPDLLAKLHNTPSSDAADLAMRQAAISTMAIANGSVCADVQINSVAAYVTQDVRPPILRRKQETAGLLVFGLLSLEGARDTVCWSASNIPYDR